MTITLDITGFYYSIEVNSEGVNNVLEVLEKANGVRSDNGGVLTFEVAPSALDPEKFFVTKLTVNYDADSNPTSRQNNSSIPGRREIGTYSYTDDVTSTANRIGEPGNVGGVLVWQYYVFDQAGKSKNESGINPPARKITPVNENFGLTDGDRIVWRLVGIFGLNEAIDNAPAGMLDGSDGQPLSLKAAAELYKQNM